MRSISGRFIWGANKELRKFFQYYCLALGFVLLPLSSLQAKDVKVKTERVADVSHFEFSGKANWDYKTSKKGNLYTLRVPVLSEKSIIELQGHQDAFIQKIQINPIGDQYSEIKFFLRESKIDSFDYLTDQPSRLIVDFFFPENPVTPKKGKAQVTNKNPSQSAGSKKGQKSAKKSVAGGSGKAKSGGRTPAGAEFSIKGDQTPASEVSFAPEEKTELIGVGLFDGADPNFNRFTVKDYEINEESKIQSKTRTYIRFPPYELAHNYLKKIVKAEPIYEITPENNLENKEARLILTTFKNKRYGSTLKTIELFKKKYPVSKYDQIIDHIEGDSYYQLFQKSQKNVFFERAMTKYSNILHKYKDSPLSERTALLMGYSYVDRGQSLDVIRSFERFSRDFPNSKFKYQVRIAIAEAYRKLKKFKQSRNVFRELKRDPEAGDFQIEAAYRIGDTYFHSEKNYETAIGYYKNALDKHKRHWSKFPNAYFNIAEANFWLENYRESLDYYRGFLQLFPSNSYGGFAMTRVGEILEILGADNRKVLGAFLESIFRYRDSQGAQIARIKIIGQRMAGMKEKELATALDEVSDYVEKSSLNDFRAYSTLILASGFEGRKEYDKGLQGLLEYYKENVTSEHLPIIKRRIIQMLTKKVEHHLEQGDYLSVFKTYGKNISNWLKNSNRIDLEYYLAKAFEKMGVPKEANKIYRKVLNRLYATKGTKEGAKKGVLEDLPTIEAVNLRLASVAVQLEKYPDALRYLKSIESDKQLSEKERVEYFVTASKIFEAKNDLNRAEKYLVKLTDSWKGKPAYLVDVYLKLGSIYLKKGMKHKADISFSKIVYLSKDVGIVPEETLLEAMKGRAEVLMSLKKKDEAKALYLSILEKYGQRNDLDEIRFKAGEILFNQGELKEAEKTWANLDKSKNKIWYRMAQEKLNDYKWTKDYQKYIKRIPAMAGFRKGRVQ